MKIELSKIEVKEGKYRVGDIVGDSIIKSFGKSCVKKIADDRHFHGQIWQECSCGCEPVYTPSLKCEKCIEARYAEKTRVVEAYVEKLTQEEKLAKNQDRLLWNDFLYDQNKEEYDDLFFDYMGEFNRVSFNDMRKEYEKNNKNMTVKQIIRFLTECEECKSEIEQSKEF